MTTARKRAAPRRTARPIERPIERPMDDDDDDEVLAGNMFDAMDEDSYVVVKRRNEMSKEMEYLYRLTPDECTEEEVARLSGGGYYVCRVKRRNESGAFVLGQQRTVRIAGPPREPLEPMSAKKLVPPGMKVNTGEAQPAGNGMTGTNIIEAGLVQLFQAQAEVSRQGQETTSLLLTKLMRDDKPSTDWSKVIVAAIPIVEAMIKRPQGDNALDTVSKIAGIIKETTSPATDLKSQLEVIGEFVGLKHDLTPEPMDPMASLAQTLPKIIDAITAEQKAGRTPTPEAVQASLVGQPAVQPHGTVPAGGQLIQGMLAKFGPRLVEWAQEGKEPETQAAVLLEIVKPQIHGYIRELLGKEDAAEQVFQAIPALREFEQWATEFFNALTEYFYPEDETVPDEPEDVEFVEVPAADGAQVALDEEMAAHDAEKVPVSDGD